MTRRASPVVPLLVVGGLVGVGALVAVALSPSGRRAAQSAGTAAQVVARTTGAAMQRLVGMAGKYFSWAELMVSQAAGALGIDNTPPPEAQARLVRLVEVVLDPLRAHVGQPIRVGSGYRHPDVNKAIRGASQSMHMSGEAADIKLVSEHDAGKLARHVLASGVPFDQLIGYHPSRGGHVHLAYTERRPNRKEVLWAPEGGGYEPWTP